MKSNNLNDNKINPKPQANPKPHSITSYANICRMK